MGKQISLVFGCDHAGLALKQAIITYLKTTRPGCVIQDVGTQTDTSCDYPDFAIDVAKWVQNHSGFQGVLVCGTGIGMSMAANRFSDIRAAVVHDEMTAKMAKEHNDANVLCLGARIVSPEMAKKLVDTWLDSTFEGGRHQKRVQKLS